MKGMFNNIFSVNLSDSETKKVKIDDAVYDEYLGGRGLGVKIFTDNVSPNVDALSP